MLEKEDDTGRRNLEESREDVRKEFFGDQKTKSNKESLRKRSRKCLSKALQLSLLSVFVKIRTIMVVATTAN